MWSGNRSTSAVGPEMRSSCVITGSLPGARPMPRSMRPGARASSAANCSATTRGAWFGSMTPPEPTRMRSVRAAVAAMSTGGVVDATAGMLWCSANQYRVKSSRSASCARRTDAATAPALVWPLRTGTRSSTERRSVSVIASANGRNLRAIPRGGITLRNTEGSP